MIQYRLFHTLVVLCILANAYDGYCDDAPPDNTVVAKELFTTAELLFEKKAYLEAAAAFQRAYDLAPHPSVLSNIGYCYEYAGERVKAVNIYQQYLNSPFEKDGATVSDIENRLAMLKLMVGALHVQCQPTDCAVEVNGVIKGKTQDGKLTVILEPGQYAVTARNDSSSSITETFPVEAGAETNARFSFILEGHNGLEHTDHSEKPRNRKHIRSDVSHPVDSPSNAAFYILSGGAVLTGIFIPVFGGLTLAAKKTYKKSDYRDADARDTAIRRKMTTNMVIGLASALAAGALTVRLLKRRKKRVSLTLNGAIVGLSGSFQ